MCNFCQKLYKTYDEALGCEALPVGIREFQDGDSITFDDESSSEGVRFSYTIHHGVVKFAYPIFHIDEHNVASHVWIYIVDVGGRELEVIRTDGEFGETKLYSPAEWKFNNGYAETMRANRDHFKGL